MSLDQWLVRTSENKINGPYTRDQVVRQIQEGELSLQDEVCQASRYWFFLHETREVQVQLGVQVPRSSGSHEGEEEITETQTDVPKRPQNVRPQHASVQIGAVNSYPGIPPQKPQAIENPSIWRGFAWALVVAAGVIVYSVLKLLR